MRSLKEFIGKRSDAPPSAKLDAKTVYFLFQKIIREEYGARGLAELEPVGFADGVLSVKAHNPLYSSELWMRRETIIGRVNHVLEQDGVRELRLVRYTT